MIGTNGRGWARRTRSPVWFAGLVSAAGFLLVLGTPAGAKKRKAPPPPSDVPGHVNYLMRELAGAQLDDAAPVTSQVQNLVLDDLREWLTAHPPTGGMPSASAVPYDVQVRRRLEHDFSLLRYPFVAEPAVFVEPWQGGTLVGAGYMLGWTDQDRTSVLAFFELRNGKTRLVTLTPFQPGADLHYAFPVPAGGVPPGEFWALAYGDRLGKSHPRLCATLYAFDGARVKPVWLVRDIYDGQLQVQGSRIVIRHMKEQEFVQAAEKGQPPAHYEAIYQVTPSGVVLESDAEVK